MTCRRRTIVFILPLFIFIAGGIGAADNQVLKRFAMYIGSNDGGEDRVRLAYAASDARAVADVLAEMGGIGSADRIILTNPDSATLDRGFDMIRAQIERAKPDVKRVEFLLYYSGHSDDEGLLLGSERYTYAALRSGIENTGADVNIAILDSCSSGAFTRLKGGVRKAPFLVDDSVHTSGYAYLTSSSADEAAQESDSIEASFFTHYLVSALRGAADSTRDGKVTLNEAYSYASSETLARTTNTQAGPQHPSYDIKLSGSGDLVLTDLRSGDASIVVADSLEGRIFIRDGSGRLVAELRKLSGVPMTVSLPSGNYTVILDTEESLYRTTIVAAPRREVLVRDRDFSSFPREITRSRGSSVTGDGLVHEYNRITLIPELPLAESDVVVHNISINLIGNSYRIQGVEIGGANFVEEDVRGTQFGYLFNSVGGSVVGLQLSGFVNLVGGDITGGQAAGIFNITEGQAAWFQSAGVFNVNSGGLTGFQGAGVFNINGGSADGFQGAGVFNVNDGDTRGFQGAGVFNVNGGDAAGFQGSGIFNVNGGNVRGFQGSGIFNASEGISGFQASLVNVAGTVNGAQFGLVNVGGTVNGTQIGLVNISGDLNGIPIGLINISGTGLSNASLWSDESGYTYIGFQLGAGWLYSILYAGAPYESPDTDISVGLGLGLHFPFEPFYIDVDLSAKHLVKGAGPDTMFINAFDFSTASGTFPSLRLSAGFGLFKHLAVFGGVILDGHIGGLTTKTPIFHEGESSVLTVNNIDIELYPRWFAGLRF